MSPAARRVLVAGACGRMGERVRAALAEDPELRLGAALEAPGHERVGRTVEDGVVVGDDPRPALAAVDVAIFFATPAPTLDLLAAAAEAGVPAVVGTTGFDAAQRAEVEALGKRIPIVLAPNFSVTVNVLAYLVERAAALLGEGYDAELVELHHAAKRDAPSGTALRLAQAVAAGRGAPERLTLAREGETGPRKPGTIGVQTLRGGDNPGEHTVLFIGQGERLELTHRSATRDHFARGAVRTARWLLDRPPGLYGMEQVLEL